MILSLLKFIKFIIYSTYILRWWLQLVVSSLVTELNRAVTEGVNTKFHQFQIIPYVCILNVVAVEYYSICAVNCNDFYCHRVSNCFIQSVINYSTFCLKSDYSLSMIPKYNKGSTFFIIFHQRHYCLLQGKQHLSAVIKSVVDIFLVK